MIKPSKFVSLAQDLVEASSALLRHRTINIMDLEGIIIASTEHDRIGTFHSGAKKVVETGKDLAITRQDVSLYTGAKEGYNMPLIVRNQMVGVIGIYGNPTEVLDLARLLKVYASRYFELEDAMTKKLQNTEIKNRLFKMLLEESPDWKKFQTLMGILGIGYSFPRRSVVIQRVLQANTQTSSCEWELQMLANQLKDIALINSRHDLWGISDTCLIIIKNKATTENGAIDSIVKHIKKLDFSCRIVASTWADDLDELSAGLHCAIWSAKHFKKTFVDLEDKDNALTYMILHEGIQNIKVIQPLIDDINSKLRKEELLLSLESAEAYYQENRSVTKAAERLFIHKNTLQNRVKRLTEGTALLEYSSFQQECILRFLIEYYRT